MEFTILIVSLLTAVASCAAAWGAFYSAKMTRSAGEAAVAFQFLNQYIGEEMMGALQRLSDLYRRENFANEWKTARDNKEDWAMAIDRARRLVSGYFINIAQLYDGKLISTKLLKTVAHQHGINVLFEVNEPLEEALNPRYGKKYFQLLRTVCGPYEDGKLF